MQKRSKPKSKREAARDRARHREYANRSYMNRMHRLQVHTEVLNTVCHAVEDKLACLEMRIEEEDEYLEMMLSSYCALAGFLEEAHAKLKAAGCPVGEESERWVTHVSPKIAQLMEENARQQEQGRAEMREWEAAQARTLKVVESQPDA